MVWDAPLVTVAVEELFVPGPFGLSLAGSCRASLPLSESYVTCVGAGVGTEIEPVLVVENGGLLQLRSVAAIDQARVPPAPGVSVKVILNRH